MKKYRNVTIVMITKNEKASVKLVIQDVQRQVPGSEILIVDSSNDNTATIAKKMGAKIIRQYPAIGYGPAMEKALLTPKRELIVTMDCDNTYPTEAIPKLIKLLDKGYDIVGTSRISMGRPKNMRISNYVVNRLFNIIASFIFQRKIHDVHSGMRVYKRDLLHKIRWQANGAALPVELLLKPIKLGYSVIEIPIKYKRRLGFTKLDRFNSSMWTFRRIFGTAFLNIKLNKNYLFYFVPIILLVLFYLNNLFKYSPYWGYDANSHIGIIQSLSQYNKFPEGKYYASNPPLFYLIASGIFNFFKNLKSVQVFTSSLFFIDILFLYYSISYFSKNKKLNIALIINFALLSVTINFAYMVFNYTLGYFFMIGSLFLLILVIRYRVINYFYVVLLSILINLGILTSLNSVALLPIALIFFLFLPSISFFKKIKYLLILSLITLIISGPYFLNKQKLYGCFFCTFNRVKTNLSLKEVYPLKFYYNFNLNYFNAPYYPNHLYDGMWPILYQTTFNDYFGYLVDSKHNHEVINKNGLISTGWHYISKDKIFQHKLLAYLGLPITFSLIYVLIINLKQIYNFLFLKQKKYFSSFFFVCAILIFFIQFLIYILRYPDYVNISAGYLFPIFFILYICLAKDIKNLYITTVLTLFLMLYSFVSYYSFFIP